MITTLLIYTVSVILGGIASFSNFIAHGWSPWPPVVLNGLTYFFTKLYILDWILNITEMLKAFLFLINFLVVYMGVKLLMKLFNFSRGSGELDV